MIKILENMNDCCGCGACVQACPKGAIKMETNGLFSYPVIDQDKCVDCNLCQKVCPIHKEDLKNPQSGTCFATANNNKSIKKNSSSGGVFYLLAKNVLDNNGYVCGACFNADFKLQHQIIDNLADLKKLQKSKYTQSEINGCYIKIAKLLMDNKEVFFVGTPCQVAGLKSYLKIKNINTTNLLTADLVCHGVPSPIVLKDYLKETLPDGAKIVDIDFRYKETGWKNYLVLFKYTKDNKNSEYMSRPSDDLYMQGFLKNLYLRKSCLDCQFTNITRPGDITLGDFWGINQVKPEIDDNTGVSLILINSDKGIDAFDNIKSNLEYVEEFDSKIAQKCNPVLEKPCSMHKNTDKFLQNYNAKPIRDNIADCLEIKDKFKTIGLMNFHFCLHNFGAVLVPFALSEAIKSLGYTPEVIDYKIKNSFLEKNAIIGDNFNKFRKNFLNISSPCDDDLSKYNDNYSKIVVGSDQIWVAPNFKYYLNWASGKKTFISYAASFGQDSLIHYSKQDIETAGNLLSRFDAVSVREESGIVLANQLGRRDAKLVLDPTMLLSPDDYQKIIDFDDDKSYLPKEEYIAYMFLDKNAATDFLAKEYSKNMKCINILKDDDGNYRTVGAWINLVKNSKMFITDSFHGAVFSILHHKEFLCYKRDAGGNTRLENLLKTFKINQTRFFYDWDCFDELLTLEKIDYKLVDEILIEKRKISFEFLKNSLLLEPINKYALSECTKEDISNKKYKIGKKGLTIIKIKNKNNVSKVKLFKFIPLLKIKDKGKKKTYKLFNFIPILKQKQKGARNKFYLFGFIYIGEWQ